MMNRRQVLKGSIALAVVAALPKLPSEDLVDIHVWREMIVGDHDLGHWEKIRMYELHIGDQFKYEQPSNEPVVLCATCDPYLKEGVWCIDTVPIGDPSVPEPAILGKAYQDMDAGYFYAPYIPMVTIT